MFSGVAAARQLHATAMRQVASGGGSVAGGAEKRKSGAEVLEAVRQQRREERERVADSAADPEMYHVPTLAITVAERGGDVANLWKLTLGGKRCIVISGVDGIGKSTTAAEYCEAVKKTKRYTCVQWFNARHHLQQQLQSFVQSVRGRKEKDVLLVFDDVRKLAEVAELATSLEAVGSVLITSSDQSAPPPKLHIMPLGPLSADGCKQLAAMFDVPADTAVAIGDAVGRVPLLVELALVAQWKGLLGDCPAAALAALVISDDGALRVSQAAASLVKLLVERDLEPRFPGAGEVLALLSCFHLNDLSAGHIEQLQRPHAMEIVHAAAELQLVKNKWNDDVFTLHPTVAAALITLHGDAPATSAELLLQMWPRRWRSLGGGAAQSLVWHTVAVYETFRRAAIHLTPSLLTSMERAGMFLCHGEGKDHAVAAELWMACHEAHRASSAPPANAIDLAAELGKVLHVLRDSRAEAVLAYALDRTEAAHGRGSVKHALVLTLYAPYATDVRWIEQLDEAAALLSSHVQGGSDETLFEEEVIMYKEASFVLQAQSAELQRQRDGGKSNDALLAELSRLADDIKLRRDVMSSKAKRKLQK